VAACPALTKIKETGERGPGGRFTFSREKLVKVLFLLFLFYSWLFFLLSSSFFIFFTSSNLLFSFTPTSFCTPLLLSFFVLAVFSSPASHMTANTVKIVKGFHRDDAYPAGGFGSGVLLSPSRAGWTMATFLCVPVLGLIHPRNNMTNFALSFFGLNKMV